MWLFFIYLDWFSWSSQPTLQLFVLKIVCIYRALLLHVNMGVYVSKY